MQYFLLEDIEHFTVRGFHSWRNFATENIHENKRGSTHKEQRNNKRKCSCATENTNENKQGNIHKDAGEQHTEMMLFNLYSHCNIAFQMCVEKSLHDTEKSLILPSFKMIGLPFLRTHLSIIYAM